MFSGLRSRGESWLQRDRERRSTHCPDRLAQALEGLGLGQQEDLLERLHELPMPALFVAGGGDAVYVEHALRMASAAPLGMPVFLPRVGHAVVGEAPRALARVIQMGI